MIKIALRPNLKYPIFLIIWTFLRKIISILISKLFSFQGSVIYTFLMLFGEMTGFILYKYQINFVENKFTKARVSKGNLIISKPEMIRPDGLIKVVFLVFMTAFFDFSEFIFSTYYITKVKNISGTLQIRLGGILIIVSSLLYWYSLKFQILRHQKFSLVILGLGIIILIATEFFFQKFNIFITKKDLAFAIILSALSHICIAFNNTIEKYLIDFDFLNPFLILTFQGIIGFIFTIICSYYENPIPHLKNVYNNNSTGMFTLFIFLLLFYTIFGALKNIYRMVTIMLFTPMNKHLADIIINPIYIIYSFSIGDDFINDGNPDYFYFFSNIILLIIFDIFGLIFNEFLILNCCSLEYDTYQSISERSLELNNYSEDDSTNKSNETIN